ncbi:MAG TPA: membrane protein insertase YidC [Sphingomonadaceae bacterium]|nr:membrane protein insertase YidC [Sphingomonadaceae bacterium]
MDNPRNLILALVLSAALLFGWDYFVQWYFPQPDPVVAESSEEAADPSSPASRDMQARREGGLQDPDLIAREEVELEAALAEAGRVEIAAPKVAGSISPVGARIDDITLTDHRQAVDRDSPPVQLFSPLGTPAQYFAQFGFVGEGVALPGSDTLWEASGEQLTPASPVTLRWDNGEGQVFSIAFSIDENYMITAEQSVANNGEGPIIVQPFALINRTSETASISTWNVHSGPIGAFDGSVEYDYDYEDVAEEQTVDFAERADWIGFTDIYWLSTLIPEAGLNPHASFRSLGDQLFRADLIYQPVTVAAGGELTRTTKLFAGAKESDVLGAYEDGGIVNFSKAIDWGWFEIIEKPILWLLKIVFDYVGNFGVAIMILTVIVRGLMFPIAQKQFASMAAMRAIQPKMKAIQERYKDDKPKQQQEIMALYKKEGVNPLAGCLPIFLQIPIFFALYKVLIIAIDMRHQPFALWLTDLSAPDPAHLLNLFGLLPYDVPSFIAIGPLALLLGITMWLQFKLNPAQMDPIQQQMFMIMPWVLMFIMAPFAAGLLLYWNTSNVLTIAQQWYLYSKHPQLKAQADKDKADKDRAAARDKKK